MDITMSDFSIRNEVSPSKEPYDVVLTLHHRGELSLGDNRRRLGFSAYHWGILLVPKEGDKRLCYAFDTTNAAIPDTMQRINLNPDFKWVYRVKNNVNPDESESLLIRIEIGELRDASPCTIRSLLGTVQLPIAGVWPPQNCVDWIRSAICILRNHGHAFNMDNIDMVMARALAYADSRIADPDNAPCRLDHLGNKV
ncbi:unnamed protein product [Penicillium salamii]|nr:unnamed protein product [Penicillium salamii]CAG8173043.1 unnamed protein product [Penicillium salamii]CAG8241722.1 unnamed protein product [Penicillium salamii]